VELNKIFGLGFQHIQACVKNSIFFIRCSFVTFHYIIYITLIDIHKNAFLIHNIYVVAVIIKMFITIICSTLLNVNFERGPEGNSLSSH
jgi:hypothetical protein